MPARKAPERKGIDGLPEGRTPVQIVQEAQRLQGEWYPRAALFGILFALKLFALAEAQDTPLVAATAAMLVLQQMLNHETTYGDFEFALRQRFRESANTAPVEEATVQGFVDFIALAWATLAAAVQDVAPEQMYGDLDRWRQFRHLPADVQLRSKQFVMGQAQWASHNLWPQSLPSIHTFLDLLLIHLEQKPLAAPYRLGLQSAHDSVLLYLDLLAWWQLKRITDSAKPA